MGLGPVTRARISYEQYRRYRERNLESVPFLKKGTLVIYLKVGDQSLSLREFEINSDLELSPSIGDVFALESDYKFINVDTSNVRVNTKARGFVEYYPHRFAVYVPSNITYEEFLGVQND